MINSAPYESAVMRVEPQWIDFNGHLNMAYYNVLFDHCCDAAFEPVGLGPDYVRAKRASFYTLEVHVTYLRELKVEAPVRITLQLLDFDAKRCHFFQQMYHAEEGFLAATSEQMCMHVDMVANKSAPFPDDVLERVKQMHAAHAHLATPPQVGHVMRIPRKG